jgi:hypothetical protein
MLNLDTVLEELSGLTLMKFFPSEIGARVALAKMIGEMAETDDQVKWLIRRVLSLYNEWPGHLEIRAVFCSRFRPRDGQEAYSAIYPGGIPSQTPPAAALPQGTLPELPPGHIASMDEEADQMIRQLSEAADMNRSTRPRPARRIGTASPTGPPAEPLNTVPNPNFRPITEADINRAVEEMRNKRALAELHGAEPSEN